MKNSRSSQVKRTDAQAANEASAAAGRVMRSELVPKSRTLARVLRHRPELWGVRLDREGWCQVEDLLAGAARNGEVLTAEELREIVETNDKKRFSMSKDGLRIRAAQGHSVDVELKLRTLVPPPVLYHETVRKHLEAIRREGLRPMHRHAVHLSETKAAAVAVGSRRGAAVVLIVDSFTMNRDGLQFQQAENGTWLTAAVPARYLNLSRPSSEPTSLPSGNHIPQNYQSLLMHQAAVSLIIDNPALVRKAQATLARWMSRGDPRTMPLWEQWRHILDHCNWARALEDSAAGSQLRQASPLSTLLSQQTRLEIIAQVRSMRSLTPLTPLEHEQLEKAAPKERGKVVDSLLPEGGAPPRDGIRRDPNEDD